MQAPQQSRVDAWLLGMRLQGLHTPKAWGDFGWAGFFLRSQAGWLVATFRSYERERPSRPGSSSLGQAGSRAAQAHATGHLRGDEERVAGGNQALGSAGPRGLFSRGSAGRPLCASSRDSTLKGSGPGPAWFPPHVRSPDRFMTSDAGAIRGPAGVGLAEPSRREASQRTVRQPETLAATPPFVAYKKASSLS